MRYFILTIVVSLPLLLSFIGREEKRAAIVADTPVVEVLQLLGEPLPDHYATAADEMKIEIGRQLVLEGKARIPGGGSTRAISRFFICTDCHNQVQEDPILSVSDPDARLAYAIQNDLPFLQATTFWGISNREHWYNDDYFKKYGALVEPARNSLAEATQLCAKECSSGRYLEEWELECILQYYRTIELHVSDLNLSDKELVELNKAVGSEGKHKSAVAKLKSRYMLASPAHLGHVPEDLVKGYDTAPGNPQTGKEIYERSCKTCHSGHRCSQFILDDATVTFKKLRNHLDKHTYFNLYEITRKGTYAQPGHKQYMPMYPLERLSDQQLEDLRAYVEQEATGF
ncbi:MAG: cytochrome c [Flavobacteriales bacterium]|nr:cytochrome c [Flavobacteriales bacterium]